MKRYLILLCGLLLAISAYGENPESTSNSSQDPETPAPRVIYKASESYKFSGLKLKGHLKKPDLSYIYKRAGLRSEQIVDIPEDFNDEIIKGAGQF